MHKLSLILEGIKRDNPQRWTIWTPSKLIGPMTFHDLLHGKPFIEEDGIYIIWGEVCADRPLYVGKTTKGYQRPLEHWRNSAKSFVGDILDACKPESLFWLNYFCPITNLSTKPVYLNAILQSYERKIAKAVNPWFWHDGFRESDSAWESIPWYIRDYVKSFCERALNSRLSIEITRKRATMDYAEQLALRIA